MSLFPHGIDILRKTDFYAVSVRRNAFLVAAPQIAEYVPPHIFNSSSNHNLICPALNSRHTEYRLFLIDHLLNVTLRHWDISMRALGAQSLRLICELDLPVLGPECAHQTVCSSSPFIFAASKVLSPGDQVRLLDSADAVDIHGSLLALTELSDAYRHSGDAALDQRRRDVS